MSSGIRSGSAVAEHKVGQPHRHQRWEVKCPSDAAPRAASELLPLKAGGEASCVSALSEPPYRSRAR